MRYHDYHLREYRVSDFGKRITLHLVYDHAGQAKDESHIEFIDVALYHFTHTGGAVVTQIEETGLADLLGEAGASLVTWHRQQGLAGWKDTLENYQKSLQATGHRAWRIESAIGFQGFVVARSISQVAPAQEPAHSDEWAGRSHH
jgi:hypothetical protein